MSRKKLLPAPRGDAGVVTCIQPRLILRGVVGLVALARRTFQRQCQPQLLVPTRRFHEAVALDAIRSRSYASEGLATVPTMILCEHWPPTRRGCVNLKLSARARQSGAV